MPDDPLTCRICGKTSPSYQGLHKHLKSKHGVSAWEYVQKHPDVLRARILSIVKEAPVRSHLSPCWVSTGRGNRQGYTQLRVAGAPTDMTHRLAVWAWQGTMPPEDSVVLHACDNPPCCNPEHLSIGTHTANMADRGRKGRQVRGRRCHNASLTPEKVQELRLRRTWGWKIMALADHFGISKAQTERVLAGTAWAHVEVRPEDDGDFIPW